MAGALLIAQGIDRRRAILRFIRDYIRRHGFSPSVNEVAAGVKLRSHTAVRHHIDILIDEGYLAVTEGKYRSLRPVSDEGYPPPPGGKRIA